MELGGQSPGRGKESIQEPDALTVLTTPGALVTAEGALGGQLRSQGAWSPQNAPSTPCHPWVSIIAYRNWRVEVNYMSKQSAFSSAKMTTIFVYG